MYCTFNKLQHFLELLEYIRNESVYLFPHVSKYTENKTKKVLKLVLARMGNVVNQTKQFQ